jgi:hypothetical protein
MGKKKSGGAKRSAKNQGGKSVSGALYSQEGNILFHDADGYDFPKAFQWANKTDTVYGITGSDPYNPGNRSITDIYGAEAGNLPQNLSMPYSFQWEYEFSPSTIVLTFGGNDSDNISEQPLIRDVMTGSFTYKDGTVAGQISKVASAQYENQYNTVISGGSSQTSLVPVEEISIWSASSPVSFSGLRSLGQVLGRRFQSSLNPVSALAKIAAYSSSDGGDRSVVDQNGFGALIASGWNNNPFATNLA